MDEYINRTAFLEQYRSLYCSDCDRRKNSNGKIVYEIGDAPCRACDTGDMLDAVEDFPAANVRENTIRTQADRIRAMSDEKLAGMFCRTETCGWAYGPSGKAYWLEWLKSPAGGEQ